MRIVSGALAAAAFAVAFASPSGARADDAAPPPATTTTTTTTTPTPSRVLPTVASVVPGVVVHGVGHWLAGDPDTAGTLLAMEGIGVGAALTGTLGLFVTGASRKLVAPNILLMVGGAGLFATSWLADVYGTASGGEGTGAAPQTILPAVESALGYRYVYDPTFAYRSFVVTSLDARYGRLHLRPEGWFSPAHANERVRVLAGVRLSGPRPVSFDGKNAPDRAPDGSYLDVETAVVRHAYPPERFTMTQLELGLAGRMDLRRLARSFRGSFFEGGAGWAFARHDYAVENAAPDFEDQLLARIGFGAYIGRPRESAVYGETAITYDHRHDGFAAGLKMPGLGSGASGGFGARGLLWFMPELGALAEAQAGSALVFGLSVLVRQAMVP